MKRLIFIGAIVFLGLAAFAYAQGPGYGPGAGEGGYGGSFCPYCGAYTGPRGGWGMGPGMMGGWGHGYGMGPGMMGGWGRGYRGYGQGAQSEACQKFLDETAGLRKDLHNKRYEYFEALRNPGTKPENIAKMEKEIIDLQEKIYAKNPRACWWQ